LNLKGEKGLRPLLLGSYINVSIDSGILKNVFAVPRAAFRDDNTLWIMNSSGKLEIRKVDPIWRDENFIYLKSGLADGEKLVLTDISTPLKGMNLRENVSVKGKE